MKRALRTALDAVTPLTRRIVRLGMRASTLPTHDEAQTRDRLVVLMFGVALLFGAVVARLVWLGAQTDDGPRYRAGADMALAAKRPRILDRDGRVLAMDVRVPSLFAEPKLIERPREVFDGLRTVLPDLDEKATMRRLTSGQGFVWLRREITPDEQADIIALGLPGLGFRHETKRFYPSGVTVSHIVGHTDIDNRGIAGFERHLDDTWLRDLHASGVPLSREPEPVRLSVDLRVQHAVRDVLADAMERYRALAASAVMLDVRTGEVVALASLPDYDPNRPVDANEKDRINRVTKGVYEMGSTFKAFTTAMALDSGKVTLGSRFDATRPLRFGRFTISDYRGKKRVLSTPEVFIYSSNIGTAKMADAVGIEGHRAFIARMGLMDRLEGFQLPEIGGPIAPKEWKKLNSVTISYGHGITTTPLQTAVAAAALVNGGTLPTPTLVPRSAAEAARSARPVIKAATSDAMRYLFRLNVIKGSGKRADVPGFLVGGKTGTAEKVINGRYVSGKRFNAFLSAFPIDEPRYVVLVTIDEPKAEKGHTFATAGMNAAPMVGRIVARAAPLLGVHPDFRVRDTALLSSYRR